MLHAARPCKLKLYLVGFRWLASGLASKSGKFKVHQPWLGFVCKSGQIVRCRRPAGIYESRQTFSGAGQQVRLS